MAVRDTFTEVGNTALASHSPDVADGSESWVAGSGTWQINASGYMENTATGGGPGSVAVVDMGEADGFVEVEMTDTAGGSNTAGPVVRYNSADNTGVYLLMRHDNGAWTIREYNGSSFTTRASGTLSPAPGTGMWKAALVASGSKISFYADGVLQGFATITNYQTQTQFGVRDGGTASTRRFDNLRVFTEDDAYDVVPLAGQSNMIGRATATSADVHDWQAVAVDQDGQLVPAYEPLHHVDPVAGDMGLSLQYARDYIASRLTTGRYLLLVPAAEGGTGFSDNKWNDGDTAFENAVTLINAAVAFSASNALIELLWHQGEKDRTNSTTADAHLQALRDFVADIRTDLSSPSLKIVMGGLVPDLIAGNALAHQVQNQIKQVADETADVYWVDSAGLDDEGDDLHFDRASALTLGSLYAAAGSAVHP